MKAHVFSAVGNVGALSNRPVFDLIRQLPRCEVIGTGEIDYEASDPALIRTIGENAAQVMATMHMGISAVGLLLANAGPEVETRSMSADVVEAVGYLLAEIADIAVQCDLIATSCRRYTADYAPLVIGAGIEPPACPSSEK